MSAPELRAGPRQGAWSHHAAPYQDPAATVDPASERAQTAGEPDRDRRTDGSRSGDEHPQITTGRRPGPALKRLLHLPVRLYDWHLGWILGHRFLRLTHVGRSSGRTYHTILEVLAEDPDQREVFVMVGFGRSSDWYRNLLAGKAAEVAIARQRYEPCHRELEPAQAVAILAAYERRNRFIAPLIKRILSRLLGWRYTGTDAARLKLVHELPIIALRARGDTADR